MYQIYRIAKENRQKSHFASAKWPYFNHQNQKNTSVRAGTAFSPCPNASVYLLTIFLQLLEFLLRI